MSSAEFTFSTNTLYRSKTFNALHVLPTNDDGNEDDRRTEEKDWGGYLTSKGRVFYGSDMHWFCKYPEKLGQYLFFYLTGWSHGKGQCYVKVMEAAGSYMQTWTVRKIAKRSLGQNLNIESDLKTFMSEIKGTLNPDMHCTTQKYNQVL